MRMIFILFESLAIETAVDDTFVVWLHKKTEQLVRLEKQQIPSVIYSTIEPPPPSEEYDSAQARGRKRKSMTVTEGIRSLRRGLWCNAYLDYIINRAIARELPPKYRNDQQAETLGAAYLTSINDTIDRIGRALERVNMRTVVIITRKVTS
ncbi:hypothetical protein Trydic_g16653 [Trypoxylus dichotomus]